jgi:hypothetical protein
MCADVKSVETFLCKILSENRIFDKHVSSSVVVTVEY